MSRKTFRPWSPHQAYLIPPSPDEWLPEDHLVHFILEVVGELDLSGIEGALRSHDARGQKGYHPRMMVALLLYSYCSGVYSSRRIAKATYEDLATRYLTLLARAEAVDREEDERFGEGRDAFELPEELKRRETRLARIRQAKAELEAEAKQARAAQLRDLAAENERKTEDAGSPTLPALPAAWPRQGQGRVGAPLRDAQPPQALPERPAGRLSADGALRAPISTTARFTRRHP